MEEIFSRNFIEEAIDKDLEEKVYDHVQTRFPPEPNGYLHIGHAKAISIDFGMAEKYNGKCNLRLDDTNPTKEDTEYVDAIMEDIKWLGFKWDKVLYASDYFDDIYAAAVKLIKKGKAYVDDLSPEEIREYRGTLKTPGKNSPYRERTIEENLDLFERMTNGEFADGAKVLRAKIDMASPNLNMRDPIIYRILRAHHHRTGDKWVVYPMYDFAHPISDTVEGVTHSLCSLEFEDHRPLYDWVLKEVGYESPSRQIEFARMNLNYTLTSKRRCLKLVRENIVSGWDDPRMSTLCGMRRRGYTPEAIRDFCERIGVSKANSVVDFALLEACIRDDLNKKAPRAMAVLRPIKLIIDNYPEDKVEQIEVEVNPENPEMGKRTVEFSRELYIEEEDFMEDAPKKYFRLSPGREVRLKSAYYVTCTSCEKDEDGNVLREWTKIDVEYERDGATLHLGTGEAYDDDTTVDTSRFDDTRVIGDVTVQYSADDYKAVPADYEPTAEEQAAVEAGDLQIGYGASEVTVQQYQFLRWEQNGVYYTLSGFDLDMTADELFQMAQEIIES